MASEDGKVITGDPTGSGALQTAEDFFQSGWRHYSSKEFFRAEADFQKAIELSPDYLDSFYGLGMTYQASNRQPEAIKAFEKVINMLAGNAEVENVRAHMLSRLARGHINLMKTGDWNLGL